MSSEKHETSMLVLLFLIVVLSVSFPLTISHTGYSTNCMLAAAIYVDTLEMQCKLVFFSPEVVVPRTCHSYVVRR